jgi:PAS domain S-box-containing protein
MMPRRIEMTTSEWPHARGECAGLVRELDWDATGLGPTSQWPASLRTAVELLLNSPVAMVLMWGPSHVMIYNDAYVPIAADKHPRAFGGTVPGIWPEIWDWNREVLAAGLRGEQRSAPDTLMHLQRADRVDEIWFDLYYSPVRVEEGRIGGVLCTVVDITERKRGEAHRERAEADLRAQRDAADDANRRLQAETGFLRALFAQAPTFMAVLRGPDHVYDLTNADYQRVIGGLDVIGRRVGDVLPQLRAQGFVDLLDRVYRSGAPYVGRNVSVVLPAGRDGGSIERVLDFVYQPIRGTEGEVNGIFVAGSDVTERRRAELELLEANDRLSALFNQAAVGICQTRLDGVILDVNQRYCEIVGRTREQLLGLDRLTLVHPDDLPMLELMFRRLRETGEAFFIEKRYVLPDGGVTWVSNHVSLVADARRGEPRISIVVSDINERRRATEALKQINETLGQRVREEVEQRARVEDALRQAQKMEAVGQLTGGIAHDFNNLLQSILMALELTQELVRRGRGSEVERFIETARSSARRAAALTHRLLAFSRRQPLDPTPVDANRLLQSIEDLLTGALGASIRLVFELDPQAWSTRCDRNQLESAILNLAINARDAMPAGGTLTIRTVNRTLPREEGDPADAIAGDFVCIQVRDTGSGMAPEVVQRAFDPFFTTKPMGQGTGLGLSMIYGFARQSGGDARIESAPGAGTTVSLLLPRRDAETAHDEQVASGAVRTTRTATILLVEDEMPIRVLVADLLEDRGHRVLTANDGLAGLRQVESGQPLDLLISDIGLPGLNGRQLADSARIHRPQLPILLMTGYADDATASEGFLGRGMHLLTKPFTADALLARVDAILGGGD